MAVNGWSFWTTQNNRRIVVYVANNDKAEALKIAQDYLGDFVVDQEVAVNDGVIKLIGLGPNQVTIAVVQEK